MLTAPGLRWGSTRVCWYTGTKESPWSGQDGKREESSIPALVTMQLPGLRTVAFCHGLEAKANPISIGQRHSQIRRISSKSCLLPCLGIVLYMQMKPEDRLDLTGMAHTGMEAAEGIAMAEAESARPEM